MKKFVLLGCLAISMQWSAVYAMDDDLLMRLTQFSGAKDEYEAEIPLHRDNWKLAMQRSLDYMNNGDFVEAQRMVEIARNEAKQMLPNDPSLAETEKLAGDIARQQKDLPTAERAYRRSVYLFERADGADQAEFAAALKSYAVFLKQSNRVREASRYEARANSLRGTSGSTAETHRAL